MNSRVKKEHGGGWSREPSPILRIYNLRIALTPLKPRPYRENDIFFIYSACSTFQSLNPKTDEKHGTAIGHF